MTVLQPQTKGGRKPSLNHPTCMLQLVAAYSMGFHVKLGVYRKLESPQTANQNIVFVNSLCLYSKKSERIPKEITGEF